MNIEAVVFDLDGTLVDSEPFHRESRGHILQRLGLEHEYLTTRSAGCFIRDFFKDVIRKNQINNQNADELTIANLKEVLSLLREHKVKPTRGTIELLTFLKKSNIKRAIASQSDEFYVLECLKILGLEDMFDFTIGGDEITYPKPAADIYLKACSFCDSKPSFCIAIEDSDIGMESAKAAGMYVLGYADENAKIKMTFSHADDKIKDMVDAKEKILKLLNE